MIRFFAGITGTILVCGASIASVFGTMGWLGMSSDTTFMLVPMLLTIAVSIGYTVHISNFFTREFQRTGKRKQSIIHAVKECGWPILFTCFTTISGLLSFMFVSIQAIRWVGLVSSASIAVVYILTMIFFTAYLSIGKDKQVDSLNVKTSHTYEKKMFSALSRFVLKEGRVISVLFILGLAVMIYGFTKVEVDLDTRKMMGLKLPHIKEQMYIADSKVGSMYSYDLTLQFSDKGMAKNPEVLKEFDKLSDEILKDSFIKRTTSICNYIKEYYFADMSDNKKFYKIPDSRHKINQLLRRHEKASSKDARNWTDKDYTTLRLFVEVSDYSSNKFAEHIKMIEAKVAELFPEGKYPSVKHALVGNLIQISIMNQYVTRGQILSTAFAVIVITMIMIIVFGSFKLGLIAMIPNVSPAIVAGGLMGYMNAPLEFVTMTIAPMVIGLAVDDTIHFINHAKLEFYRTRNYNRSLENTFVTVGSALTKTTIIICVTFAAFTVSRVNNMVNMGIYTIAAISSALIADFFVTPWLIKLSKPFGREDQS